VLDEGERGETDLVSMEIDVDNAVPKCQPTHRTLFTTIFYPNCAGDVNPLILTSPQKAEVYPGKFSGLGTPFPPPLL